MLTNLWVVFDLPDEPDEDARPDMDKGQIEYWVFEQSTKDAEEQCAKGLHSRVGGRVTQLGYLQIEHQIKLTLQHALRERLDAY